MIPLGSALSVFLILCFRGIVVEGWSSPTVRLSKLHASLQSSRQPSLTSTSTGGRYLSTCYLGISTASASSDFSDQASSRSRLEKEESALAQAVLVSSTEATTAVKTNSNIPFPLVLWKFSRPHTLIGSAIAIPALHLLAAPYLSSACTVSTLLSILYAMIPSLLMNIYITGLNQITDIDIDRINKPYLVLPAGLLTKKAAAWTVLVCLATSLMMGHVTAWSTPGLAFALWGSAVLGTLYSLPPFRLKRFPLLAAFCIVAVRGTIINASFFAHATAAAFGGSGSVLQALLTNDRCLLSSLFYCVFGVVIALMKDVPDVDGDRSSNVRTFSVRIGQQQVFHASRRLLTGLFWVFGLGFARSAVTATTTTLQLCRAVAAVAAFLAGNSVRRQSRTVDPTDSQQVYTYYMHLWKLFYASYLALPFAR